MAAFCGFLVLAAGLLFGSALHAQPADGAVAHHIVQAQWFTRATLGFTPPPYALGDGLPSGEWTAVELPYSAATRRLASATLP